MNKHTRSVSLIDGHIEDREKDEIIHAQADKIFLYEKVIKSKTAEIERLKTSIKEADTYFCEGEMGKGLAVIINLVKEMPEER